MQRDRLVDKTLREQGWQVVRFWHQEIKNDSAGCAGKVLAYLKYSLLRQAMGRLRQRFVHDQRLILRR